MASDLNMHMTIFSSFSSLTRSRISKTYVFSRVKYMKHMLETTKINELPQRISRLYHFTVAWNTFENLGCVTWSKWYWITVKAGSDHYFTRVVRPSVHLSVPTFQNQSKITDAELDHCWLLYISNSTCPPINIKKYLW